MLCLVQFVDVLGVTSATTAIPAILSGVGAGTAAAGPLATVYAMLFGGLLLVGARLGDRIGHRRMLLVGVALFGAVSILGGTAPLWGGGALSAVLVSRALQGAAAALSVPSALRLLLLAAPEPEQRRGALAGWSATGAAAGASGFLVGGILVQFFGWPAVFWVNLPLAILLAIGIVWRVTPSRDSEPGTSVDALGAALLIASVMALIAGAAWVERPATRGQGLVLIGVGLVAGGLFAWRLATARRPLIPRDALASRPIRAGTALSFVNTATTSSAAVLASLFLQQRLGLDPIATGLTLIVLSLCVIPTSAGSRMLLGGLTPRAVAGIGLGTIAIGCAVLTATTGTWWGVLVGIALCGAGLGPSSVAANSIGTSVSASLAGTASGVLNTGAQLGTALGVAFSVLVAGTWGVWAGWLAAALLAGATAAVCFTGRVRGGGISDSERKRRHSRA